MSAFATGLFAALIFAGAPRADEPKDVKLVVRVYPVGDLVRPLPPGHVQVVGGPPAKPMHYDEAHEVTGFEPLLDLLKTTVAPGTWAKEFRKGDNSPWIQAFFPNSSLIVKAPPDVHEQVIERLRQLRRLAPIQGEPENR